MTREKQINDAVKTSITETLMSTPNYEFSPKATDMLECAFTKGAEWADAHPINPWHKVSEELPEETCEVLICWDTYSHYRKWTQIVMFYRDVDNPEEWWFEDEDGGRPEPDYWMPIPELPKEDRLCTQK